ncbi:MAG: caspase family protein, partial [Syntrophales bacterium]|nr:caspase family protein [Syntrophales bacterium]
MKVSPIKHLVILSVYLLLMPLIARAAPEQRTALVIGNSAYSSGSLKNPATDATAMAAMLMELGFTVTLKKNAKQQEMDESIREFGRQLKRTRGVGLFYYAGHGIQIGGVNYLLPVNARIEKESDARFQSVSADHVLSEMENAENGLNIVILDACRDNPYSRSFRNATRGLAIVSNAPSGTFISYSTGANQVARDGEGKYSPYTRALLENIVKPGLTINKVFMNVRSEVKKETGQIPWESSSLEGDFYFVPGSPEKLAVTIPSGKTIVGRDKSPVLTAAAVNDLDDENRKLEAEHRLLVEERASFAKKKALEEKRQQIAEEKERFLAEQEAERLAAEQRLSAKKSTTLAMAKRPSPPEDARIFTSSTLGAKFVLIPAGTFMMGSPSDETGRELYNTWEFGWGKETQHQVTISKPFYIQTTEVTQGQWQKVMGNNPSFFKNCGENCPVESVSWNDVQEFIRKLNQT